VTAREETTRHLRLELRDRRINSHMEQLLSLVIRN
jgi:hypothetical protein